MSRSDPKRRQGRHLAAALLLGAGCWMQAGCATQPVTAIEVGRAFWPQFPAEPRIQFLVGYSLSSDIEPPSTGLERLVFGSDAGVLPIIKPYGVAMWDDRIYVCDIRAASVVVLDLERHRTSVLRTRGMGGMVQPTDITVADDGKKYVVDLRRGVIFVFDTEDRHLTTFGLLGLEPVGIAVWEDELFVCDFGSQSVVVFDRETGEVRRHIGERGDEDGQFVRPLGVDVDRKGDLYVVDVIRCRLQKFDRDGRLLMASGYISDTAGAFVRPKHLAVDDDGVVYVVDAAFSNVQMFDAEGQVLMFFGSGGNHPGSMDLPAGICINETISPHFRKYVHPAFDAQRLIVVTNQFGPRKVSVYAMGELRPDARVEDLMPAVVPMTSGVQETEGRQDVPGAVPGPPVSEDADGTS